VSSRRRQQPVSASRAVIDWQSIAAPSVGHTPCCLAYLLLYLFAFAAPASLDQAVRRIAAPPRAWRMRAYRVLKYLHVPARLRQEPSQDRKIKILALQLFHRVEATCSVRQQALAQLERNHLASTLSPHVTFDCDPIGTPDLARRPLQSTGGTSCPDPPAGFCKYHHQSRFDIVASRLQIFTCSLHGSQAGFSPTQMTYNINRSTSRTVETSCQNGPPPADDFLGRTRSVG